MTSEQLHIFLKENRKSFPNYFRIGEIKRYNKQGKLHILYLNKQAVGFYVLDGCQFKNLFIKKEYRKQGLVGMLMAMLQINHDYLTIAVNENSSRMVKFCKKYGFRKTDKQVQGKTYKLKIYEYKRRTEL